MALRDRIARFLSPTSPAPKTQDTALADARRNLWGMGLTAYNPDELVGKHGLRIYDEMRHDEQIKVCLALKKAAVIGPGWKLNPSGDDEGAQEFAELLTGDLLNLPGTFGDVLDHVLSALTWGFSWAEPLYALDDRLHLASVNPKAPHGLDFHQDPYGTVEYLTQTGVTEHLDPAQFLIFTHQGEFANAYGISDLRSCHRAWWHKKLWHQIWGMWGEKLADPPVVGKYPPNTADGIIRQVQNILSRLSAKTAITVPAEWDFSLLVDQRSPREVFIETVNRLDLAIAKGLLIPDKLGVAGGEVAGGSYSLAKEQMGAFFFVLEALKARLEACIQEQLINRMAAFEAPDLEAPKFTINPLSEENKQAIAEIWGSLIGANAVLSDVRDENHLRDLLGFPDVEETTDEMRAAIVRRRTEQRKLGIPWDPVPQQVVISDPSKQPGEGPQGGGNNPPGKLPTATAMAEEMADALPPSRMLPDTPGGFWRTLTAVEKRADMAEKRQAFADLTPPLANALAMGVAQMVADIKATVQKKKLGSAKNDPGLVRTLAPKAMTLSAMRTTLQAALEKAYAQGAKQVRGELRRARAEMSEVDKKYFSEELARAERPLAAAAAPEMDARYWQAKLVALRKQVRADLRAAGANAHEVTAFFSATDKLLLDDTPRLTGSGAGKFWRNKAFYVTGVLEDEVLRKAKATLFAALRQDTTPRQVLDQLDADLGDWLPETDRAGKIVNVPARIELVARTNIAEGLNEGRWAQMVDPDLDGFVTGFQYSAVLDNRTRENHAAWDGVSLPANSEEWFRPDRRPPNGYQCRCSLVPVTVIDEQEWTAPEDLPSGDLDLPDKNFR